MDGHRFPNLTMTDTDLDIARPAIQQARRQVLKQLFAAAMQTDEPERRQRIIQTISRILERDR
jgi:hypothetical protein